MNLNLKALIGKLNDTSRQAMEAAAGLCLARTHYDIEIEHYLLKALDSSDNDIAFILSATTFLTLRCSRPLKRATNGDVGSSTSP